MNHPTIESLETLSRELAARLINIGDMLEEIAKRHAVLAGQTPEIPSPPAAPTHAGQRERIATFAMAQIMAHPEVVSGFTDVMNDEISMEDYADVLAGDAVTLADALVAALAD